MVSPARAASLPRWSQCATWMTYWSRPRGSFPWMRATTLRDTNLRSPVRPGRVAAAGARRPRPAFARFSHRPGVGGEHDHGLAANTHVFVVAAAALGRDQAVADEHHLGSLDVHFRLQEERAADEILVELPGGALLADAERRARHGRDSDERNVLDVGAVRVAGTKARALELRHEVIDGELLPARPRRAALEFVGCELRDVALELERRDALEHISRRKAPAEPGRHRRTGGE